MQNGHCTVVYISHHLKHDAVVGVYVHAVVQSRPVDIQLDVHMIDDAILVNVCESKTADWALHLARCCTQGNIAAQCFTAT